jgi:hypothetical protein
MNYNLALKMESDDVIFNLKTVINHYTSSRSSVLSNALDIRNA